MKTHQEIRDAIENFELPPEPQWVPDSMENMLKILHALNDRIEAKDAAKELGELRSDLAMFKTNLLTVVRRIETDYTKLNKVVTGLCDIHP